MISRSRPSDVTVRTKPSDGPSQCILHRSWAKNQVIARFSMASQTFSCAPSSPLPAARSALCPKIGQRRRSHDQQRKPTHTECGWSALPFPITEQAGRGFAAASDSDSPGCIAPLVVLFPLRADAHRLCRAHPPDSNRCQQRREAGHTENSQSICRSAWASSRDRPQAQWDSRSPRAVRLRAFSRAICSASHFDRL